MMNIMNTSNTTNTMNILSVNNMKLKLHRDLDETNEQFNTRKLFIRGANPKNEEELIKIVRLSFIYRNMIILGCKYPSKLENLILNYNI